MSSLEWAIKPFLCRLMGALSQLASRRSATLGAHARRCSRDHSYQTPSGATARHSSLLADSASEVDMEQPRTVLPRVVLQSGKAASESRDRLD
jgi:hypothetical protein